MECVGKNKPILTVSLVSATDRIDGKQGNDDFYLEVA